MEQKPLELILARNFLTNLSTPAFLFAADGTVAFYNEAAGALLGPLRGVRPQARRGVGPQGRPVRRRRRAIPIEELPITKALRQGRPGHGRFVIRSVDGAEQEIEGSAFPIVADTGQAGAMVFFWPAQ